MSKTSIVLLSMNYINSGSFRDWCPKVKSSKHLHYAEVKPSTTSYRISTIVSLYHQGLWPSSAIILSMMVFAIGSMTMFHVSFFIFHYSIFNFQLWSWIKRRCKCIHSCHGSQLIGRARWRKWRVGSYNISFVFLVNGSIFSCISLRGSHWVWEGREWFASSMTSCLESRVVGWGPLQTWWRLNQSHKKTMLLHKVLTQTLVVYILFNSTRVLALKRLFCRSYFLSEIGPGNPSQT